MRRPRFPRWYSILFVVVVIGMAFQASRLLRAEPPTAPRAKDVAKAGRTASSPGGGDEREPPAPPSVAVGNGVVEPVTPEVRLGAGVPGLVARVTVAEGQHVEIGDPIVELDRRVEAAALASADADVLAARAELDRIVRGSRAEDIRAARAEADAARARAALAENVAERIGKAAAAGALTGDELDRARGEAEAAAADARGATAREQAAIAGSRREDIQVARARLVAAEARRDQAAAAAARLSITSPIRGEVIRLPYRVGEYYQQGSEPLAVIGDTSALRVRVDIDERDIDSIALGAPVIVRASAFSGRDFPGRVVEIGRRMGRKNVRTDDPTERNDTKILEVVVALDGKPPLVVGQRVTAYAQAVAR